MKVCWKLHWNFHFSSESLLKVSLKLSLWLCKFIESFTKTFTSFFVLNKLSIWQWKFPWNFQQTCNLRVKVSLKLSTNLQFESESFIETFNKLAIWEWKFHWNFQQTFTWEVKVSVQLSKLHHQSRTKPIQNNILDKIEQVLITHLQDLCYDSQFSSPWNKSKAFLNTVFLSSVLLFQCLDWVKNNPTSLELSCIYYIFSFSIHHIFSPVAIVVFSAGSSQLVPARSQTEQLDLCLKHCLCNFNQK